MVLDIAAGILLAALLIGACLYGAETIKFGTPVFGLSLMFASIAAAIYLIVQQVDTWPFEAKKSQTSKSLADELLKLDPNKLPKRLRPATKEEIDNAISYEQYLKNKQP